jgi:hypothetical protein
MESGTTYCSNSISEWVHLGQLVARALIHKPLTQVGLFSGCMLLCIAALS